MCAIFNFHETLLDDRIRGKYDCLRHQNQRKECRCLHVPYLTVHETLLDDRIRGKYDCLRHQNQRKLRYVRRPCACTGQKWWRTQNVLIANFFYQVIKENCVPHVRLLHTPKKVVLLILPYDNVYRSMCESHTYGGLATQVVPYDRHSHLLE